MINGIICIDKPAGFTSFGVVAKLRGMLKTKSVGHAGTLDPMATGVLPVFIGRATKACDMLPDQNKRYTAGFRLGITTDTQDITGNVLSQSPVEVKAAMVEEALVHFRGEILQIPPMYSAIQVNGRRLYDIAREGREIEREPRPVKVYSLELTDSDEAGHNYTIDVFCSKGTYIRTLCHDIGGRLGCGATLTSLRRTYAGGFSHEDCITLETANRLCGEGTLDKYILQLEAVFKGLPKVELTVKQVKAFQNGVRLFLDRLTLPDADGDVAVYDDTGRFMAIAAPDWETGVLISKKLFIDGRPQ